MTEEDKELSDDIAEGTQVGVPVDDSPNLLLVSLHYSPLHSILFNLDYSSHSSYSIFYFKKIQSALCPKLREAQV